jgi:hypothetical protein
MTPPSPDRPADPRRAAAEVVELGQSLFDAVIDVAAGRAPADPEGFPEDQLRGATEEFFRAVKLLLGLPAEE